LNALAAATTEETDMPATHAPKLYLEDLKPGDRFISREHALDEAQIIDFATHFDPQPFHLDPEAAKRTFFQGLAASGWHTAAITMRLQVTSGLPIAGGIVGAGGELTWPRPTRATDVLHVVSEVVQIAPSKSKPDRGIVTFDVKVINQHGNTVQEGQWHVMFKRK
jgi:acyl dehydratase